MDWDETVGNCFGWHLHILFDRKNNVYANKPDTDSEQFTRLLQCSISVLLHARIQPKSLIPPTKLSNFLWIC